MNCNRCKADNLGQIYCSNCIKFGKFSNQNIRYLKRKNKNSKLVLNYALTIKQQNTANLILKTKGNVLVDAVCGAGKTEIVTKEIELFLSKGKRVGILIPRVQLAKEFFYKLTKFFPKNNIKLIHGSSAFELGDIVVLTCHKAFMYVNQLDLVIIDEVDAFPLSQDLILQAICFNLARLKTVYLSSTPPDYLPKPYKTIIVNIRFHGKPLPIPKIIKTISFRVKLYSLLNKQKRKLFVYFPTIKMQTEYYKKFKDEFNVSIINSKTKNSSWILHMFRRDNIKILFTTSVLERGVTFQKLDVVVVDSNHELFNKKVLIQIAGRVGRKIFHEEGSILFLTKKKTYKLKNVIKEIKNRNNMYNL